MKRLMFAPCLMLMAFSGAVLGQHGTALAAGGNSAAAQACQQGGYLSLLGANLTAFGNTGQCVSYAAQGGQFATGLIIPAGHTATLTNVWMSACDALTYGYQINLGANVPVGAKNYCGGKSAGDTTVGPFPTATLLRLYLSDDTCGATYYSDGNHAAVFGSNPYVVDILDSGLCRAAQDARPVPYQGYANFQATVTIS